jgi:DNA-binding LytR/AlgR family response regulator
MAKIEEELKYAIGFLESVKKKSIIEHIILKNKSTVHLDDLYYIRADDHYLELITKTKIPTFI